MVCGESTAAVTQLGAEIEALCDQYLRACSVGKPVLLDESEASDLALDLELDLAHGSPVESRAQVARRMTRIS